MKKKYNNIEISLDLKLIDIINPLIVLLIKKNKKENIIKSCKILIKNDYDVYSWFIKILKNQNNLLLYIDENIKKLYNNDIDLIWAIWINDWLTHIINCLSKINYKTVFCCEFEKDNFIYSNFDQWLSVISNDINSKQKSKLYDIYKILMDNKNFMVEEENLQICDYCNDENENENILFYFHNKYPKYL
jgi:hypothetical protein